MRYFHRTSVSPEQVLAEAERFFEGRLEAAERGDRMRRFTGTLGEVKISVRAEGGHYVHLTAETDQVGESEVDKMAKGFLSRVHKLAHPSHEVRGAY